VGSFLFVRKLHLIFVSFILKQRLLDIISVECDMNLWIFEGIGEIFVIHHFLHLAKSYPLFSRYRNIQVLIDLQ
jgi:hypothetical protein